MPSLQVTRVFPGISSIIAHTSLSSNTNNALIEDNVPKPVISEVDEDACTRNIVSQLEAFASKGIAFLGENLRSVMASLQVTECPSTAHTALSSQLGQNLKLQAWHRKPQISIQYTCCAVVCTGKLLRKS